MSIVGMKTIDGQNMNILKVQNHSIQVVDNVTGQLVYEDSNYTAFQVHATNAVIPANEIYAVDVPAGMIERFRLRTDDDVEDTDVIVDWGDGSITKAADLPDESVDRTTDLDDQEFIFTFQHEYTQPGKYIVKITGKKYWGFQHNNTNNIVSRILDSDLPLAQNVQNIAGLCSGGNYKLVSVHVPTGQQLFTNIHNASSAFANCHNLKQATGFDTKFRFTRTVANFFQNCQNLCYTDFQLPVLCIYANAGMNGVYRGCTRLGQAYNDMRTGKAVQTTIQKLIPPQGFASRAISMTYCFYGCSSLDGIIPASYLWRDTRINWTVTSAFTNSSSSLRSQVPASWGGVGEEYVPDQIQMPIASTNVLGAVKVDGITITADNQGTLSVLNGGGGGGGSGLLSQNNTLLDQKSIAVGTDNVVGGYGVRITAYYASNNAGESYLDIASAGNEADGFEDNSGITNPTNTNASSVDWTLLTSGTTIRIFRNDITNEVPIISQIDSRNINYSRLYLASKLVATNPDTEATTDLTEQDLLNGFLAVSWPGRTSDSFSITIGTQNGAVGQNDFVTGNFNNNAGLGGFVAGANNINAGTFGTVIGFGNSNSGDFSIVLGSNNKYGDTGIAIGSQNELISSSSTIGQNSVSIGYNNKAYSNMGINIGLQNETWGRNAFNIGQRNKTYKPYSMAIGYKLTNNWQNAILIGTNGLLQPQITYNGSDQQIYKSYKNAIIGCCGDYNNDSIAFEITNKYYYCNPNYTGSGANIDEFIQVDSKLFEVKDDYLFKVNTILSNRTLRNKTEITGTASTDIDLTDGSYLYVTVSSAITLEFSNGLDGQEFMLVIDGNINNVTFDNSIVISNALTSSGDKKYVYKGFVIGTSVILTGIGVLS